MNCNLSRTPGPLPSSSRTAARRPPQIIQTLDDNSGEEIVELTDSSIELTPLKIKNLNYKHERGERSSSAPRMPVRLGGDESIIVL